MNIVFTIKNKFNAEKQLARFRVKIILVFLQTIGLVGFTIALQYTSYVRTDELGFLKWAAIIRHNILHIDPKPLADSVVFIDVSKDIITVDDTQDPAPGDSVANLKGPQVVITDRHKLAKLFSELNRHPAEYKYVLCDLVFDQQLADDTILKKPIEKVNRLIVAASFKDKKLLHPIFKVDYGAVNYLALNGSSFVKIPVFSHYIDKTLPIVFYEKTTVNRFSLKGNLVYLNGRLSFSTIIPELYYRNEDLIKSGAHTNTYDLFYLEPDPDFFSVLKNKYVIIGNFSEDRHNSYLGSIPGSLLLWDTYLTLRTQPLTLQASWLILLFIFYFLISYWIIIHPERKLEVIHKKIHVPLLSKFIIKYISFLGMLIVLNLISYFYYGTFISLFFVATYLTFLELVINKFQGWRLAFTNFTHKIFKPHEKNNAVANSANRH